jgi:cytoskeletal protein RodZ
MTVGGLLAAKRGERGLTIQQAASATRIRAEHLAALEADETERFAAAVYAKGYLRNYALYLGLDPEPLVGMLHDGPRDPRRALGLRNLALRPRLVLTAPAVASAGLVLLATAFAIYAWRQIAADQRPSPSPAAAQLAAVTSPATTIPSPSPQARPIVVGITVTDVVWINVIVDGKAQYTDAGKTLQPGSQVYFTGVDVKVTSGKAAATFITVDGHALGALGAGVATREFSSQTSP